MKPKLVTLWVNVFQAPRGDIGISVALRTKRQARLWADAMKKHYIFLAVAVPLRFFMGVKKKEGA